MIWTALKTTLLILFSALFLMLGIIQFGVGFVLLFIVGIVVYKLWPKRRGRYDREY